MISFFHNTIDFDLINSLSTYIDIKSFAWKIKRKKPSQILIWNSEYAFDNYCEDYRQLSLYRNLWQCGQEEAEGGPSPTPDKVSTVELASVVLMWL